MVRSEDVCGWDVVSADGEKAGVAEAVVYSPDSNYIRGIVFETSMLRRRKFVAQGDFELQSERVLLKKDAELMPPPQESEWYPVALDRHMEEVGYISELYIDEDTGRVCALEIASNAIGDIVSGRRVSQRFRAEGEGVKVEYD